MPPKVLEGVGFNSFRLFGLWVRLFCIITGISLKVTKGRNKFLKMKLMGLSSGPPEGNRERDSLMAIYLSCTRTAKVMCLLLQTGIPPVSHWPSEQLWSNQGEYIKQYFYLWSIKWLHLSIQAHILTFTLKVLPPKSRHEFHQKLLSSAYFNGHILALRPQHIKVSSDSSMKKGERKPVFSFLISLKSAIVYGARTLS